MKVIQRAQMAVSKKGQFKNVRSVATDVLEDEAAAKLYPTWRDNFEEWERTGSDHRYHYLGSAIWFTRIGQEFGEAMMSMIE